MVAGLPHTIRDLCIDDHFTCVNKGFPPPDVLACSVVAKPLQECKEGLHETVDSVLGKYFK